MEKKSEKSRRAENWELRRDEKQKEVNGNETRWRVTKKEREKEIEARWASLGEQHDLHVYDLAARGIGENREEKEKGEK